MTTERDKNWHYASETADMLRQTTAHIQLSMHEGQDSITSLTDSFRAITQHLESVRDAVGDCGDEAKQASIHQDIEFCTAQTDSAVVSMQFYDTLTQRLEFVANALQSMSELIHDTDKRDSESQWLDLQQQIIRNCHIQSDAVFLEAIRNGKSFDEAHQLSKTSRESEQEVELF
ncbi:MAG: hypothetical protein HUJ29_05005 [Gammaproteobacteria bacterium]|nr:hypothetical protein [Gammaproteobacteria bacterium]